MGEFDRMSGCSCSEYAMSLGMASSWCNVCGLLGYQIVHEELPVKNTRRPVDVSWISDRCPEVKDALSHYLSGEISYEDALKLAVGNLYREISQRDADLKNCRELLADSMRGDFYHE